ncbi:MAG: endo-1,4-beta-xylanase, partial [Puniceicoccales bacterium]|nr:endo-1,4-beta-xylanase [Puniceicoccales bacterium]
MRFQKQTKSVFERFAQRHRTKTTKCYIAFFKLFSKYQDKISRVTLWRVTDNNSWRNNWPVPGRTDYALLFDHNFQPKPIVNEIILRTAVQRDGFAQDFEADAVCAFPTRTLRCVER